MKPVATGQVDTAGSGGMSAAPPAPSGPPSGPPMGAPMPSPDDTPMLSGPTTYPDEPLTAGLPSGAGPGPMIDNRKAETKDMQRYLPLLQPYLDKPDVPDSVRMLFRYIRAQ